MEETLKQRSGNLVRVVLYGPESTGKTTLAKDLATHYHTEWVPEYAREYLQEKWDREKRICEPVDILPIARGQMKLENELSESASRVLICDTNLLVTKVYSEVYYDGYCDPLLEKYAILNEYDIYFLTYIDVPWVADDLRDKPEEREEMFEAFRNSLDRYNKPYVILKGDADERLNTAINHINNILKAHDDHNRS
ncbi:AAA family ATPase [Robertkochia solimangrovi]|uniref:AAA family ATPase n=1 Tax=Robertkochia solimangrovi TaxID=2213046 RepID=UPI0011804A39|nr:ATP-binding protein [Robertkochia solimangrovi]TRZ46399.1 nicotinate-nucleotide adenylyltransferase [Robertkochia solimangrovi]